jgi:hypothetical protein
MNKLPVGCGWAFALNCMNVVLEKSCEDADLQARQAKFGRKRRFWKNLKILLTRGRVFHNLRWLAEPS